MNETKPSDGLEPLTPYLIPNENSNKRYQGFAVKPIRWFMSKVKPAVVGAVLLLLVIPGCATKTITIKPECEVPQLAPLPVIMSDDMECLADDVYWALIDRERLLTDWALEMEATLGVICN